MKQAFSILLLLLIAKSYAQDIFYFHGVYDTTATTKEEALYYKTIDSSVNPIEVNIFYVNGTKYSKIHYRSLKPAIREGKYESFFGNGETEVKGSYINNKFDGTWMAYDSAKSFLKVKTNFKENERNGKSYNFYENGKLSRLDVYVRDTLVLSTCYDTLGKIRTCTEEFNEPFPLEVMAKYPGGVEALMLFLEKNIHYPSVAREKGLQGKVIVKFYIDIDGTAKSPMIISNNSGSDEYAQEAIRVVLSMPKWIPGSQKGKPVKIYYTLPITFKVQ